MKVSRKVLVTASALALGGALVALPAAASASTAEWVSTAPAVLGGNSCASPGFNSVQAALDAAAVNATVNVCAGTYTEQVQVTKSVKLVGTGAPILKLPASPANSSTTCDTAIPGSFQPNQDELSICGAITVHLSGLVVDAAWPANTCYDSEYGVFAGGGAKIVANKFSVVAAGAQPINGCQGGVGMQIGTSRTSPAETANLVMTASAVTGYQKNGIDVAGAGSKANIGGSNITGAGPTDQIAQNGLEIIDGGFANAHNNTISGNECNNVNCGPDSLLASQSAGVLLIGAAPKTLINNNAITSNDIGVYYSSEDSGAAPAAPVNSIKGNTFANDRYEGVCLDQGSALLSGNTYTNGNVGIQAIQYDGQTQASKHTANREKISGEAVAAVQVHSDGALGDEPGLLTVNNSAFHGGAVLDESDNYPIVQNHDTH
jgi:hypothetical protein